MCDLCISPKNQAHINAHINTLIKTYDIWDKMANCQDNKELLTDTYKSHKIIIQRIYLIHGNRRI